MKTLITLMILLCATTVSMAQSTVTKEVITKTEGEDGKESKTVTKYKIITTKDIDVDIDEDDMKEGTLKKLIEVLSEFEEGDSTQEKVVVKTIDISDDESKSYKVKILSNGEVKTLGGSEDVDLDEIKIKIKELSAKLEDSDAIKLVLKTIEEVEEKMEKEAKEEKKKNLILYNFTIL